MKKICIGILLIVLLKPSSIVLAKSDIESCEYEAEIKQCSIANTKGQTKAIDDFVCIVGTPEEVTYQIILDKEFTKIDDKMDKYIEELEKNKNIYFGKDSKKTYIDGINEIYKKNDTFRNEYTKLCSTTIISKAVSCNEDKETGLNKALNFFSDKGTSCSDLINVKLQIFDDIAFGVLMLNKEQIKADEKKIYDQGQRRNYDKLLNIMMINIGYLERIWQKWPSKTANPYR